MSEPPRCDDTSSELVPNTSHHSQTAQADESGKKTNKRQKKQHAIESDVDATPERFQPFDLKSLTFKPIGSEQEVNIWYATPDVFHAYISQFAHGFRKVNTDLWPLAERLALVNTVWRFCQEHGVAFPFEYQQVVPDVNAEDVPDVDESGDEPASEAV